MNTQPINSTFTAHQIIMQHYELLSCMFRAAVPVIKTTFEKKWTPDYELCNEKRGQFIYLFLFFTNQDPEPYF